MNIPEENVSAFVYGLCAGLNLDRKITEAEARAFLELLRHEPSLLEAKVLSGQKSAIQKLLNKKDLYRSDSERAVDYIYATLGTSKKEQDAVYAPTLQFDEIAPNSIDFSGSNMVFTGEFGIGRQTAEDIAESLGAELLASTKVESDYVVVGSIPSAAWKFGQYGTKVMRALELKQRGSTLLIISEEAFCAQIASDVLEKFTKSAPSLRVEGFRIVRV